MDHLTRELPHRPARLISLACWERRAHMVASRVMSRRPYAREIAGAARQLLRRLSSLAVVRHGAGQIGPAVRCVQRA